jgi:chitinase
MSWQFPHVASSWISTVRSLSWPVSGTPPPISTTPPTSTKTTSTPGQTSTPPSGSGGCSGVAGWVSSTAYTGGSKVVYNNHLWTAKWWSEGDVPGGAAGDWTDNGSC